MKFLKKSRMFWISFVSIATATLALLSTFLQQRHERAKNKEALQQKEDDLKNMEDLKNAYKTIHELNIVLEKKSDNIIEIQKEQKKDADKIIELQNELNNKNEQLIKFQKENLNYVTGGDTLVRLIPDLGNPTGHITLRILNQSDYSQYEVRVFISDNFKYQLLEKKRASMDNFTFFDRVTAETTFWKDFGSIEAGGERVIYVTDLPPELDNGRFMIEIRCRNGNYKDEIFYKKHGSWWELQDREKYYGKPFR